MQIGKDVTILRMKDGINNLRGKIIETIGSDCYKVQLYDDALHLTDRFQVFHESWLVDA
jgi:hypothetical protein